MDSEVARLVSLMGGLVNGNGAKASDMEVLHGSTRAVSVDLLMEVTFGWTSRTRTLAGDIAVHGSRCCRNADEAGRHMAEACRAACLDPGLARRAADMIAPAPLAAYRTYADGYLVGPLQGGAHHVAGCAKCGGAGDIACICAAGRVGCVECESTGKARCMQCSGNGSYLVDGQPRTCSRCHGMRRYGTCVSCSGQGTQQCGRCGGHGRTGCMPCGRTGRLTHIHTAHATGRISRTACYAEGTPNSFRTACEALPDIACLAGPDGQLEDTELLPGRGMVGVVLHCRTQHVRADLACRGERISVDAIGPSLAMPLMPPFLDGLTAELAEDIAAAHLRHPAKALELASRTRLTRDILASVGKGARLDPDASRRRWMGAVSRDHLEAIGNCLQAAYTGAARIPVRRTWLASAPLLAAAPVLANAYGMPAWMLHAAAAQVAMRSHLLQVLAAGTAQAACVLPCVLLAWCLAHTAGKRKLRSQLGGVARRGPGQGRWPVLGFVLAMAAGWASAALRLHAAPLGLPWAAQERREDPAARADVVPDGAPTLHAAQGGVPATRATPGRRQPEPVHRHQ